MDNETLMLLTEEVQRQFKEVKNVEIGSDKYKATIDGLTKLVDREIEMEKFIIENEGKIEAQNAENELKLKKMKDDKIDNLIKNSLTGFSIVSGLALTVWGTKKSIEFEKEGTFTTIMGRGFIQKLLPKK